MAGGYFFGWYGVGSQWIKAACNADGQLIIDAAAIFENPPVEDETGKGPSSEWAFDHGADAAAHHAKYTDAESRAAIGNKFNQYGTLLSDLNCYNHKLNNVYVYGFSGKHDDLGQGVFSWDSATGKFRIWGKNGVGTLVAVDFEIHNGTDYEQMASEPVVDAKIIAALENPPTEDEAEKAPTSEWAFDHDADPSAHHAKYTDAEAQAAVNLAGTLYTTIPGIAFAAGSPDTAEVSKSLNGYIQADADGIGFYAPLQLPHGATVTGAIVYGNAGAQAEVWNLYRITHSAGTGATMANANIGTEDDTITNATVDNELYSYMFITSTLDTGDRIYGARISFTL